MKHFLSAVIAAGMMFAAANVMAVEPQNIGTFKKTLIQYHDTGEYDKDINETMNHAVEYLKQRIAENKNGKKKLAIVLDIDETSLSNYKDMREMDFGGSLEQIQVAEDKGTDPVIEPTLKLYQYAKANNVAVFFITGRHENEREVTAQNLKSAGYDNWDGLILRDGEYTKAPAAVYKTAIRKKIVSDGYDIVLNIGDQKSDIAGGYSDKSYKLPNPYYFIP
ncbi:MAG TPA: HAD family acid phosphatase [Gammaproteobacteria bacterium]|jgi:acid phosphatase|nr:HAD family acid phosphatase [Gammaproteobacteria bacterium]